MKMNIKSAPLESHIFTVFITADVNQYEGTDGRKRRTSWVENRQDFHSRCDWREEEEKKEKREDMA